MDNPVSLDNFRHIDASSSGFRATKRRSKAKKATHACTACRRQKSRCEILGTEDGRLRCHRCKVLGNTCSYEDSDNPPFPLPPSPQESAAKTPSDPSLPMGVVYFAGEPHLRKEYTRTRKPGIAQWSVLSSTSPRVYDWSTAPIMAVHEVTSTLEPPVSSPTSLPVQSQDGSDTCLSDILAAEQIQHLLHVFDTRYFPWLNLPSTNEPNYGAGKNTPLLDLVRCSISARHFDFSLRSSLLPRLRKLVEQALKRLLLNPVSSIEAILSLLILALWSPITNEQDSSVISGNTTIFDFRQLVSSAVSIALTLKLDKAAEHVVALQGERERHGEMFSVEQQTQLARYLNNAYLWIATANVESLLCLGSGHSTVSKRSTYDRRLVYIPAHATSDNVRELRLGLQAELFDVTEQALQLQLESPESLEDWSDHISESLLKFNRALRLINPLPVLIDHEAIHFYALKIIYAACRLTVVYAAQRQCRHLCSFDTKEIQTKMWHRGFSKKGVHFFALWSQDAVGCTESILTDVASASKLPTSSPSSPVSYAQHKLLSSAPDRLLCIITFASMLVVMSKLWTAENAGVEFMGASDAMLRRTTIALEEAALLPDDYASKCEKFVRRMIDAWENRGLDMETGGDNNSEYSTSTGYIPRDQSAGPSPMNGLNVTTQGSDWYHSPSATTPASADSTSSDSHMQDICFNPPLRPPSSDIYIDQDFFNAFYANLQGSW